MPKTDDLKHSAHGYPAGTGPEFHVIYADEKE